MSFTDVRHASRRVTLSIVLCVKAASGSTEKGPAEAGPYEPRRAASRRPLRLPD
jgi:hypothetical protein